MGNVFVTQHFDWDQPGSWKARAVNSLPRRFGISARLVGPGRTGSMTHLGQRIYMFHPVMQALAYGVEGDFGATPRRLTDNKWTPPDTDRLGRAAGGHVRHVRGGGFCP